MGADGVIRALEHATGEMAEPPGERRERRRVWLRAREFNDPWSAAIGPIRGDIPARTDAPAAGDGLPEIFRIRHARYAGEKAIAREDELVQERSQPKGYLHPHSSSLSDHCIREAIVAHPFLDALNAGQGFPHG